MKKIVVLTLVLMTAMTGFAWAGTDAGYKEVAVNLAYTNQTASNSESENNSTTVGVVFNYFFSANFSVGVDYRLTGSVYEPEVGDSTESVSQTISLRSDLLAGGPTKTVIPYIGVHGGNFSSYSERDNETYDSSSFSYGLHGGLKMFPSERVSVNLELDYTTTEPEVESGQEEYSIDRTSLFVGASFYF